MSNNYLYMALGVEVTDAEAALLMECADVSDELSCGFPEEIDHESYANRSQAFRDAFPPKPDEEDPYASFYDLFDDHEYPEFCAGFVREEGGVYIAGEQADPHAIASLLQKVAKSALPMAIKWATTCDKLRVGEFGGGFLIITEDSIQGGSTHWLAQEMLQSIKAKEAA